MISAPILSRHKNFILALSLVAGLSLTANSTAAMASSNEFNPEVESNVWEENDQECASVTLNGKELVIYRGESNASKAEDRAEELADKLQDLLKSDKLDAAKLVPACDGQLAAIRVDGATVVKFEVPESNSVVSPAATLEFSYKVVNAIRTILGAAQIPASFLKLAETQSADQAFLSAYGRGPTTATASAQVPTDFSPNFSGHASWYGGKFHGRRTSNGEKFDMHGLTAAHRTLPFGTKLLVLNRRTGDTCVVQVNDRGPFVDDRIIDLSRGAAQKLNMLSSGVAMVDCMVLSSAAR